MPEAEKMAERLLAMQHLDGCYPTPHPLCVEASDMIRAQAAEIERLREAMTPFAELAGSYDPDDGDGEQRLWDTNLPKIGDLRRARAALAKP